MTEAGEPARKANGLNRICLRQDNQQENQRGERGYPWGRRTSKKTKEAKQDMSEVGEPARKPKRLNMICLRHVNQQENQRG